MNDYDIKEYKNEPQEHQNPPFPQQEALDPKTELPHDPFAKPEVRKGCYIATCVYGSYDCPEVWTLRRYRDNKLEKSFFGRLFIKTYYWISPKLVKVFGEKVWFTSFWKKFLDKKVRKLKSTGFDDTPYYD